MTATPSRTTTFAIGGSIDPEDLPTLCKRVGALLREAGADVAVCDVAGVAADAVAVDALARLQVLAGRYRCRMRLEHASAELRDLIAFMGLDDVLPGIPADPPPR
jgi:ABC-type transporter Mla MlaB component